MSLRHWTPSLHPRGPDGRFIPKLSHSVRVSTRSVSYNVGKRVPVGSKANLYVGGLVRVERKSGGRGTFGERATNKVVNRVAGKFGDPEGNSRFARAIKGQAVEGASYRVRRSGGIGNPNLRVSTLKQSSRAARQPRQRTTPSTITEGINTQAPRALPAAKRKRKSKKRRPQRRGKGN